MSNPPLPIGDSLQKYLWQLLDEPALLSDLRAETSRLPGAGMQISPEQGRFLAWLVHLIGAKRCLEIGVYTGYSSLCVGMELPPDGLLVACDVSDEYTAVARRYWQRAGISERIQLELQPALETLNELIARGEERSFDFAFIDADKENYLDYYESCLRLLRAGGIIAVDNCLWDGKVADPEHQDSSTVAIRRLNQHVFDDSRVRCSLIPVRDGLLLATKI